MGTHTRRAETDEKDISNQESPDVAWKRHNVGPFQKMLNLDHSVRPRVNASARQGGPHMPDLLSAAAERPRGHEVKCPIRGLFNTRVSAHEEQRWQRINRGDATRVETPPSRSAVCAV